MPIKSHKHLTIISAAVIVTLIAYMIFIKSSYFPVFTNWAQQNFYTFYSLLVLIKIVGIVWPPIPGGFFTFGSVPVIGWFYAYSADFLGSMLGSSIAFFIARKYGLSILKKIFDHDMIQKIKSVKIKPKREIESVFFFRIFGGSIVELICYGAGLLKIRYFNFLIGSITSHIVIAMPFYYFFEGIFQGRNVLINSMLLLAAFLFFIKFKDRYFE